uniref:Nucleoside phosphorylase domain-containing protein n=1 Tax=Bionectria ochroleuca TaxID=29856 RepID=A0A8H7TQ33_BIOOC
MPPLKELSAESYRVGWICPLEVEQLAAMHMLDEKHERLGQSPADNNVYNLGSINGHNVVIAGLHDPGNCSAATVVTQMRMTFPRLRYGLLVGIGGGVPVETDEGMIRLGHVVVSKPTGEHSGAIQYDHGKANQGHFERTGSLMPPPAALLNAAQDLAVQRKMVDEDPVWQNIQRIQTERRGLRRFKFPGSTADCLHKTHHQDKRRRISCDKVGCNSDERIERAIDADEESFVVVHRGTIASGELVLKNARKRDRLAQKYGLLCFEMEAAGALTEFPCLVIRGISDYCDSHKNDDWQGFAAAAAAAYARQLFFHMPIEVTQIPESQIPTDLSKHVQFLVPYNENPEFVGRSDILARLQQQLDVGQQQGPVKPFPRVALYGLGGIGKTQIALAYVYWLRETYPDVAVFWVHSGKAEQFHEAYASIARECNVPGHEDPKVDILRLVKQWLEQIFKTRWLMVIDNADDTELFFRSQQDKPSVTATAPSHREDELGCYTPDCRHGSILVTTRNKQAGLKLAQGKSLIEVGRMERNEAHLVLCAILDDSQLPEHDTHLLASKLEHIPLALAQAAPFVQENSLHINEYIQLLGESDSELLSRLSESFVTVGRDSETPHAVTATWIISFELIKQRNILASNFLSFLSFFHWQAIPKEFVHYYCSRVSPSDALNITTAAITKALGILKAFSLISEDKDRNISMHRLVQLVTRKWLAVRGTTAGFGQRALKTVSALYPCGDNYEMQGRCSELLPHASAILENNRCTPYGETDTCWAETSPVKARLLYNMGKYFLYQGNWNKAEEIQVEAMTIFIEQQGKEDQWTLSSMHCLALIYTRQGRWEEAEKLQVQVVRTNKIKLGADHPDTLTSEQNLASIYTRQGRWGEAEKLLLQVTETRKSKSGADHPHTLTAMGNLAMTWYSQGRLEEAEELELQAIETCKIKLGVDHPDTLTIMANLAMTWYSQGRLEEAEELEVQAIETCKIKLGVDHPDTLTAMGNLAMTWHSQGRWEEAEELEVQAIETCKIKLGVDHPDTLTIMANLAMTWKDQGRDNDAMALLQKCVEALRRVLGTNHPETLDVLSILNDWNNGRSEDV